MLKLKNQKSVKSADLLIVLALLAIICTLLFRKPIEKMKNYGLLEIENGFMKLTPAGMELQDAVVLEFLDA